MVPATRVTQDLKLQQTPLYQIGRIPVKDKARIIYFICPDAEGDGRGPATKTKGPVPGLTGTGPVLTLCSEGVPPLNRRLEARDTLTTAGRPPFKVDTVECHRYRLFPSRRQMRRRCCPARL